LQKSSRSKIDGADRQGSLIYERQSTQPATTEHSLDLVGKRSRANQRYNQRNEHQHNQRNEHELENNPQKPQTIKVYRYCGGNSTSHRQMQSGKHDVQALQENRTFHDGILKL